jgi:hypothetical protein
MLNQCLDRLEETIDAETAALVARDLSSMDDFNRRKSQSLLEITRIIRTVKDGSIDGAAVERFEMLREKLAVNHTVLDRYMRAVQEISNIVTGAIQTASSDGTYSANLVGPKGPALMVKSIGQ